MSSLYLGPNEYDEEGLSFAQFDELGDGEFLLEVSASYLSFTREETQKIVDYLSGLLAG